MVVAQDRKGTLEIITCGNHLNVELWRAIDAFILVADPNAIRKGNLHSLSKPLIRSKRVRKNLNLEVTHPSRTDYGSEHGRDAVTMSGRVQAIESTMVGRMSGLELTRDLEKSRSLAPSVNVTISPLCYFKVWEKEWDKLEYFGKRPARSPRNPMHGYFRHLRIR